MLSTEVIDIGDAKGCVLLWGGRPRARGRDTRAEIMHLVKDIMDTWVSDDDDIAAVSTSEAEHC